jgi:hypothetical protein
MLIMYLTLSVVVYKWELYDRTTRHVNKFKYHIPKYYIPIKSEVREVLSVDRHTVIKEIS